MFVIGTAGHIDHGKTSLINRLTGIDTDRLPEEKARGMTIDLGFAWYDTPAGNRVGIVDVPGHERFVRNMIAGAGGIDAVILVVAADDGWMPQSQEHLQITRLLGLQYGLVALTKIDLVEKSWTDLVEEDIRQKLKGTFLEISPVIRLSSITGEGFDKLRREIDALSEKITRRDDIGKPRLYADRFFVMPGMGGVVTGTLRGGTLQVGQEAIVFPDRKIGKIRTLQSHNRQVEKAFPGQRTAVSLTGVDKEHLRRGGVISLPDIIAAYPEHPVLALSLSLIEESRLIIEDRRRLLIIMGTTEVEGELRFLEVDRLTPGQSGLVFFIPAQPLLTFIGDRFIARLPTPQITIGGGVVLDILDSLPRRKNYQSYGYLHGRTSMAMDSLINSELLKNNGRISDTDFEFTNFSRAEIGQKLEKMLRSGELVTQGRFYFGAAELKRQIAEITLGIENIFRDAPHKDGLPLEEINSATNLPKTSVEILIEYMLNNNLLVKKGNRYDLPRRLINVRGDLKKLADEMEKALLETHLTPPRIDELIAGDKMKKEALDFLLAVGVAVKVSSDIVFHRTHWLGAIDWIREAIRQNGKLGVGDIREKLGSSRKYIVPLLEETDRRRITKREGDFRTKGENFEA